MNEIKVKLKVDFTIIQALGWFVLLSFSSSSAFSDEWRVEWTAGSSEQSSSVALRGGSDSDWESLIDVSRFWSNQEWLHAFPIRLQLNLPPEDLPTVSGKYALESDFNRQLVFTPTFPWAPGAQYVADWFGAEVAPQPLLRSIWGLEKQVAMSEAHVVQIFPSSDTLPENLLKFYIEFSHPMQRGGIYQHIHLINGAGDEVEAPFLEVDEELWDPQMRRLTLFIDPGRVKRGVRPLEEVGAALEANTKFRLIIDKAWQDAKGAPLKNGAEKIFQVIAPDRSVPDPSQWEICSPAAGLHLPLIVRFEEPLDYALASSRIDVFSVEEQSRIAGTSTLIEMETIWVFVPSTPWKAGGYNLRFSHLIEDLAGNQVGKPFEVEQISLDVPALSSAPKDYQISIKIY